MPDVIFQPYQDLLNDLDTLTTSMDQIHQEHMTCHSGCSGCCQQHLGVFEVEAHHLKPALAALPSQQLVQIKQQAKEILAEQRVACPLLINERCAIYVQRPVICRTHGYPLHYASEEEGEVFLDVCPLNFTTEGAVEELSLDQTLPLDRLNLRLTAINHVYCRDELGNLQRASERIPLAKIVQNLS